MRSDLWREVQNYYEAESTLLCFPKAQFDRNYGGYGEVDEVLLKILCHNAFAQIYAMYKFGVDPTWEV